MPMVAVLDAGVSKDVPTHLAAGWAYLMLYSSGLCSTEGSQFQYSHFSDHLQPPLKVLCTGVLVLATLLKESRRGAS